MKRFLWIPLLLALGCCLLPGQEDLRKAIQDRNWTAAAALFSDDSYGQLPGYFREALGVNCSVLRLNGLMYYARFQDHGEIGEITFVRENQLYSQLKLKANVKPLLFVRSFLRYEVSNRTLRMGDAEIHFKKGCLFRGQPMDDLYVFSGEWEFRIRPSNEEERLTLISLLRSDEFKKSGQAGLFVTRQPELLAGLPEPTPAANLKDEEARQLFALFQKDWGMHVRFFNEMWYFPFSPDFQAAVFFHKPGKSHFRYVFNRALAPDTSLVLFPDSKFYLNYNAVTGLKFVSQNVDELSQLKLNLFYNPQVHFLSGTAVLNFKEPGNMKTVNLDPGLVVRGFGKSPDHEIQLFNRGENYYLLGQELEKFSFYYAGSIAADEDAGDLVRVGVKPPPRKDRDLFYLLNRDQNFYPNPGQHFFKSIVKVSLPDSMQCVASGTLQAQQKLGERNVFTFESPGCKGVSLACGNFSKLLTVAGPVPIQFFGNPKLRCREYFEPEEIRGHFDFLQRTYGPLDIRELNVVLRRTKDYGGVSNQGFLICNLLDSAFQVDEISLARRLRRDSPVVFLDVNRDSLVHEMAHQWWGGVISWRSYQDQWITEGLAQFSTLLCIQNAFSESQFRRALATAKRWVARNSDAGPVIYGRRIANLSNDLETYQSIVYNKAALVFMMLRDILGEEELLSRLRRLLSDFKYQSLSSAGFIRNLSGGDARLQKFFRDWVFTRKLPRARYQVTHNGKEGEVTLTQADSDFVFPISLRITTAAGKQTRILIVGEKVQKFKITESSPILSIEVEAPVSPVELQG